jgi:hypothetical protein
VLIPSKSSSVFAALAGSLERAELMSFKDPDRIETRLAWVDGVLESAIVNAEAPAVVMGILQAGPPPEQSSTLP